MGLVRNRVIGAAFGGLAGLAGLLGLAAPAVADTSGSFGDWSVSCGNGMTCDLRNDDSGQTLFSSIAFERRADANAPVSLTLSVPAEGLADPAATLNATVDGKALLDLPLSKLAARPDDMAVALTDDAAVRALLEAMRTGKTLVLTVTGAAGKQERSVSLKGWPPACCFSMRHRTG